MQKVGIDTTQNVRLSYELGGIGDRIAAYLLDGVLILAYYVLVYSLATYLHAPTWLQILLAVPPFAYHLFSEVLMNGQSLGKRQLNLKVVKLDGSQPDVGNYLLRWLLRPIDMWLSGSIAIVTILFSKKGQRLGDIAGGTTVVKFRPRNANLRDQVYAPLQQQEYTVTFPQAERLNDEQISLIRETLKMYRETGNSKPVHILAGKVSSMLGETNGLPAVTYLHTVVKDFEYLHAQA
jgi:uncharacterized RDD family membrane protein YckC